MEHVVEPATSGRAKCRGCGNKIDNSALRFGERVENPYNDREATLWFHPECGALKRPESFLEALSRFDPEATAFAERSRLVAAAERGLAHRRLTRLDGIERAASGRATCRHCREQIAKAALRIRLVYFEAGRFEPSGFLHLGCAAEYCGSTDVLPRLHIFTNALPEADWQQAEAMLGQTRATRSYPHSSP